MVNKLISKKKVALRITRKDIKRGRVMGKVRGVVCSMRTKKIDTDKPDKDERAECDAELHEQMKRERKKE